MTGFLSLRTSSQAFHLHFYSSLKAYLALVVSISGSRTILQTPIIFFSIQIQSNPRHFVNYGLHQEFSLLFR